MKVVENVVRKIDTATSRVFFRHGCDENGRSVEVLVLKREGIDILRIGKEHWLHQRLSGLVLVVES